MATRKVTVSIDDSSLALAERAAKARGISLSAWMSQAARREAVRTGYDPIAATRPAAAAAFEDALADEAELTAAEEDMRAAG